MLLCTSDATCSVAAGLVDPEQVRRRGGRRRARTRWGTRPATGTAAARRRRAGGTTTRSSPASCCDGRRRGGGRSLARPEPVVERTGDGGHAERRRPRRRQLDGQRDAVEPPAERRRSTPGRASPRSTPAAAARCRNSSTAVVAGSSDRTASTCSPSSPSTSRLVATIDSSGQAAVSTSIADGHACRRRARSCRGRAAAVRRPATAAAAASGSGAATAPTVRAMVSATSSGSVDAGQLDEPHGGELGQQVGRGVDGEAGLADPADPGERHDAMAPGHGDEHAGRRASRPTSDERWAGRLLEYVSTPRTGGNCWRRSGCTTCHRRSGSVRSRSRCVPRSVERGARRARRGRARRRRPTAGSGRRGRRP